MDLSTAIDLIKPAIPFPLKTSWADLGCGKGLFTVALSAIIGKGSIIYAVDSNRLALKKVQPIPDIKIEKIVANFDKDVLLLSELDGILMANSLHFVKDKIHFIQKAQGWLKKNGCFLIIEYDMDTPNRWVPYPISFASCAKLFSSLGLSIEKIGQHASIYNKTGMYAAIVYPVGGR